MLKSFLHDFLYFSVSYFCVLFRCLVLTFSWFPCVFLGFHMSVSYLPYIGFVDASIRSTQNLASATWAIYAPTDELISLHGVCLGHATNNIVEYSPVIKLLTNIGSLRICHLIVWLDSHLVVLQLSNVYSIQSPTLLRVYLWILLLERHFDYNEYQHIPRCLNTLTNYLVNFVLDRHLINL